LLHLQLLAARIVAKPAISDCNCPENGGNWPFPIWHAHCVSFGMKKAIVVIVLALAAISPFMSWSHAPNVSATSASIVR
jgi:hypothetical protein